MRSPRSDASPRRGRPDGTYLQNAASATIKRRCEAGESHDERHVALSRGVTDFSRVQWAGAFFMQLLAGSDNRTDGWSAGRQAFARPLRQRFL